MFSACIDVAPNGAWFLWGMRPATNISLLTELPAAVMRNLLDFAFCTSNLKL